MVGYVSPPTGNRLGIYADEIEEKRQQLGLDEKGFRLDKSDPAENDKKEMEREMYERANSKVSSLASALGASTGPAVAGDP